MKYLFSFLLLWIITPNAFSQKPNENNAAITVSVEDPQHHPKIGETVQFRSTKTKKLLQGKQNKMGNLLSFFLKMILMISN